MALFTYRGRDRKGSLVTGELDGATVDAVAGQLAGRGITPIAIDESTASSTEITLPKWLRNERVKVDDLIMFTRQMHTITKAGIPLITSIRGLADTVYNKLFKSALEDVVGSLETGVELSAAMNHHPNVFNPLIVNIVKVGEDSGRLDEAFLLLSEYLERDQVTARRVKTALRYPSFVMIALIAAMVVVNIWVIPEFAHMFDRFGAELPLPTQILIGVSNLFTHYWPHMLVGVAITCIWAYRYVQTDRGSRLWGRYRLRLPMVGSLINLATLARYTRTFSLMLRSGVPLPRALDLSARTLDNPYLADKVSIIRSSIERGENLYQTHQASGMFTPLVLQMISVGEASGQVDTLLSEVAEYYDREVEYDLKTLSDRIEPIVIVIMAAFVLALALGIFLPIWSLYGLQAGT